MTSQRDETASSPAAEDMTDDPIIIERRDEILTGDGPADDGTGYEPAAGGGPGDDRPRSDQEPYDPAAADAGEEGTASDELAGRRAAPDTGGADPAPLVVPADADSPGMSGPDLGGPDLGGPDPGDRDLGGPDVAGPDPSSPGTGSAHASGPGPAGGPALPDPAAQDAPGSESWGSVPPVPEAPSPAATTSTPVAVVQPGVADNPEAAVASPPRAAAADGDPATGTTAAGIPAAALSEQQWPAIQALFVDDPKGSVQRAAAAADEVAKALVASLEREQAAMRASWESGSDTTTEDLRTALQQYRAFCGRLEGLA